MERSLKNYSRQSQLDRRIVLEAVIQKHLDNVNLPAASKKSRKRRSAQPHNAATESTGDMSSLSGLTHDRAPHQQSSSSVSDTLATSNDTQDGRTWEWPTSSEWAEDSSSIQVPQHTMRQGSASDCTLDSMQSGTREFSVVETRDSGRRQGGNGDRMGSPWGSFLATTPAAAGTREIASSDSRHAICMHPGAQHSIDLPVGFADPGFRGAEEPEFDPTVQLPLEELMPDSPPERQPHFDVPAISGPSQTAAGANGNAARQADHEASTGSRQRAAMPQPAESRPGSPPATPARSAPAAQTSPEAALSALEDAVTPFDDADERAWYCCDLFGEAGGSAPGLAFSSTPVRHVSRPITAEQSAIVAQALQGAC